MSVALVGAGPGSADLMTVRGVERLRHAQAVVADRLIGADVLALAARDAEVHRVGKWRGGGTSQDEINRLLIELAGRYERVVRLKGGDPFVFGRGAEEVDVLVDAGVEVEVVPGLSSALAGPSLAGVSLTRRGVSRGIAVLSATSSGGEAVDFAHTCLADLSLVVMMGAEVRGRVAADLVAAGLESETPVAVVESASLEGERVTRTSLAGLAGHEVRAPALLVVGRVADARYALEVSR